MKINASDRTYVSDAKGVWRVLDYSQNGVEYSEIYQPSLEVKHEIEPSVPALSDETKVALEGRLEEALVQDTVDEEKLD
jgi:hypothetical protein